MVASLPPTLSVDRKELSPPLPTPLASSAATPLDSCPRNAGMKRCQCGWKIFSDFARYSSPRWDTSLEERALAGGKSRCDDGGISGGCSHLQMGYPVVKAVVG